MAELPHAATWTLMAILYGGGNQGATLRNIISAGDYLNHAIVTYEELNSAITWLQAAGCVETYDQRYFPTTPVLSAYQTIAAQHRSASKQWDQLDKYLQTQIIAADVKPGITISFTEYTLAVESYIRST